jgi:single-strand DNA-binding protein
MNNFTGIGRVGRDAVVRYTGSGKAVAGWSLAVEDGWGENKQTVWLDCSLWGERAAKLAPYITRGAQLGVQGSIGKREHDGKTYVTLRVSDVTLLSGKSAQSEPQQRSAPAPAGGDDFDQDVPF